MRRGAWCSEIAGVHRHGGVCYSVSEYERVFLYVLGVMLMSSDCAGFRRPAWGWDVCVGGRAGPAGACTRQPKSRLLGWGFPRYD